MTLHATLSASVMLGAPVRLATVDGEPIPSFYHSAGSILQRDGRLVPAHEAEDLFRVLASEAVGCWQWGRRDTARRFKADAEALAAAIYEARRWGSAGSPVVDRGSAA